MIGRILVIIFFISSAIIDGLFISIAGDDREGVSGFVFLGLCIKGAVIGIPGEDFFKTIGVNWDLLFKFATEYQLVMFLVCLFLGGNLFTGLLTAFLDVCSALIVMGRKVSFVRFVIPWMEKLSLIVFLPFLLLALFFVILI